MCNSPLIQEQGLIVAGQSTESQTEGLSLRFSLQSYRICYSKPGGLDYVSFPLLNELWLCVSEGDM